MRWGDLGKARALGLTVAWLLVVWLALLLAFTGATSASVVSGDRLGLDSPAR
ncbi:hypothetical protein [Halomonas mongoliensis]|uniref:hypothetical protein n=1 Tax=Halomonas mongoliensis TaxID=321265 RepID=UPI00403AC34B